MLALHVMLALAAAPAPADLGPVPAGSVRVFLIRHGQALSNLDPEPDLPPEKLDALTPLGQAQSRNAAAALAKAGVKAVVSSPAGRARETAALFGSALGASSVAVEPRLRPLDLGRGPDGAPLDWDQRIADWEAGRDPEPPGGESLATVGRRVAEAFRALTATHAGRSVVAVAHSEVVLAFLATVDGVAPHTVWPPRIPNASVTVVEADAAGVLKVLVRAWVAPTPAATSP